MKTNDLRIGNLYYYEVQDSGDRSLDPAVIDVQDLLYLDTFPDDPSFQPMATTDELLLGWGFEKSDDTHFQIKGMKIWKCHGMYLCDKNGTILQFAHQVQNLYHSLHGTDLPTSNFQLPTSS